MFVSFISFNSIKVGLNSGVSMAEIQCACGSFDFDHLIFEMVANNMIIQFTQVRDEKSVTGESLLRELVSHQRYKHLFGLFHSIRSEKKTSWYSLHDFRLLDHFVKWIYKMDRIYCVVPIQSPRNRI